MNEVTEISEVEARAITKPEGVATPEDKNRQIEALVQFARYLTSRYPQVDNMRAMTVEIDDGIHLELPEFPASMQVEPQLNYYLAGSLATALLSRAETIDLCEETSGSNIKVARSVENPQTARALLADFARPIGDVDFVITDHYKTLWERVQNSFSQVTSDEYQQARAKYLWKGRGGPTFGEVPAEALPALNRNPDQDDEYGIMCDPVATFGTKKFARIEIDGQQYYVARPDTIVCYKILHMLQSYDQKPTKFNADFAKLHQALTGLYTEDELIQLTHHILNEYQETLTKVSTVYENPYKPKLPKMVDDLLSKQDLSEHARSFIEKVISYDQSHGQILGSRPSPTN